MTRREAIASVLILAALPFSQGAAKPLDELNSYSDMIKWLRQTLDSIREVGTPIDQSRLVTHLDDLGKNLELMLQTKTDIGHVLDMKPLDQMRLKSLVRKMRSSIDNASDNLMNVAFLVKQQHRGNAIALDLKRAHDDKESWLSKLNLVAEPSESQVVEISRQVKASNEGLTNANGEFVGLVGYLKSQI